MSADAVLSVCAHYDAADKPIPVLNADGTPETPEQARKRRHPWRRRDGEPLSYSAKEREHREVPPHANPIGRGRRK